MSKVFAALTAGLLVAATVAAGPVTHLVWTMNHPSTAALAAAATPDGAATASSGDRAPAHGSATGAGAGSGSGGSASDGTSDGGGATTGSSDATGARDGSTGTGTTSGSGNQTAGSGDGAAGGGSAGAVPHRGTIPTTPRPGTTPRNPVTPGGGTTTNAVVRSVKLTLPAAAQVGSNVLGYIHVADSNGQVVSPIPGALVTLQQQRGGSWTDLSEYLTDDNGVVALSFTSRTTLTLRAALVDGGHAVLSPVTVMAAHDLVTWAARPALTVVKGVATGYEFRVRPASGSAQLQYARVSDPTHWYSAPVVKVGPTGVVKQSVTFPAAGLWLVRGGTVASSDNASGYTSTLTVRAL